MLAEKRLTAETSILLQMRENSRLQEVQANNSENRGVNSNHKYGEDEISQILGSSVEDLKQELEQRTTLHEIAIAVLRLSEQALERVLSHLDANLAWVTIPDVANLSYYLRGYNKDII